MRSASSSYKLENRGSILGYFLLFGLAIFEFYTSGFNAFAMVCMIPVVVLFVCISFGNEMSLFWLLIIINYFLQFFNKLQMLPQGIPMSIYNEGIEILLLCMLIIDQRKSPPFDRTFNMMLLTLLCWCGFCTLEVLNDTCDLGINVASWYGGARAMAYQLLYAFLVFSLYINSPERLLKYLRLWALLSLFSVFWCWKQANIGFTPTEKAWLESVGKTTHVLNGGTLTRYWSTHNDAANFGIGSAATAIVFFIIAITTRLKADRIFFGVSGALVTWGMFQSGTRTAIFCLIAGFAVFLVLSKSFKIIVPFSLLGAFMFGILAFTTIGNGNQQIRRMRSAFDKNDASSNVRSINQDAIRKYIADAPWGLGLAANFNNVPANNKYRKLSTIPPDSEYVFIWVHTGKIGITTFLILTAVMFLGACCVVFFKLKSRSLMGVGAGFCGAFAAMQLGGYGNQVLMQFPNCLMFYGGLAIVYILPFIEKDWVALEEKRFAEETEKKRLKMEKKLASRV